MTGSSRSDGFGFSSACGFGFFRIASDDPGAVSVSALVVIVDKDADAAFRAIGRYVVAFSELVSEMRNAVALRAGGDGIGGQRTLTAEIALGEMQALPMSHAFFGLAREAGQLDDAETKVAVLLAEEVGKAIRMRNDIAHGDWQVGHVAMREPHDLVRLPPTLVRVLAHDKDGPYKRTTFKVSDLDALTDQLSRLTATVVEFGRLAFGFPVICRPSRVSTGEYRVHDIYVLQGTGKKKHIERAGPKADEVDFFAYTLPSPSPP